MSSRGLALDNTAWDSPWRRRRVRDKATLSLGLLACAIALPWWPGGIATGIVALAILLGPARVAPGLLCRAMSAPLVFIAVGAASLLVTLSWSGGPVIGITPSTAPAVTVAVRGVSATLSVFVLAATTPMADLVAALGRARVPQACIDVVTVAYRLIFVLLDSTRAVREAQAARLGYDNRRAAFRSTAMLAGAVLVRSWDRAQRMEAGLAGRGSGEALRTLDPPAHGSTAFLVAAVAGPASLLAVALWWGGPA